MRFGAKESKVHGKFGKGLCLGLRSDAHFLVDPGKEDTCKEKDDHPAQVQRRVPATQQGLTPQVNPNLPANVA
jgi:hypothetical protein